VLHRKSERYLVRKEIANYRLAQRVPASAWKHPGPLSMKSRLSAEVQHKSSAS
jgi:hypothetical protein